jgi:uncharacterized protein YjbI with pentapeptide repeats
MLTLYNRWIQLREWAKSLSTNWKVICILILISFPIFACGDITSDLVDPTQLAREDLSNQDFTWKYMSGVDLSHKNLRNANFSEAFLLDADFSYSDCTGINFNDAKLRGAKFTGAKLDEKWARIMDIVTTGKGSGLNLQGYDLSGIRIDDAVFIGTNLKNADLSNSQLGGSNFRNADFTGANLVQTKLGDATLYGAIVTRGQLSNAILSCTQLPDGSIAEKQKCSAYELEYNLKQWQH